ncbi:MAG: hypothetical protein IPK60_02155 [Sandaracinaceae bacterium]|nr:hypothetical protein [Sandaracinaceae bacterium]
MKQILWLAVVVATTFAGRASADDANGPPPPSASRPATPLPAGLFGNWCIWESPDNHDLLVSPRSTPNVVSLRIPYTSNGWIWVGTSKVDAVMWTAGNFSEQHFEHENDKRGCGSSTIAPGTYPMMSWTITVTPSDLTVSHTDNPHRFVLAASSMGEMRVVGAAGGDFAIQPTDALPPPGAPQAPGP